MKKSNKSMHVTVLCVVGMMFLMLFVSSVSAETLRILTWEAYTPAEFQQQFIQLVKEKYGVDLTLDIKFVNGNDEFFPALRGERSHRFPPICGILCSQKV